MTIRSTSRALNNLGALRTAGGALDKAPTLFETAIRLDPANAEPVVNLGNVRLHSNAGTSSGLLSAATRPRSAECRMTHLNLGVVDAQQGQLELANAEYRKVLENQPDRLPALNSLAWNLATMQGAARSGRRSSQTGGTGGGPDVRRDLSMLQTLAAAYAAAGRFDDAVATAEHVFGGGRR